jgi:hypothetical protein
MRLNDGRVIPAFIGQAIRGEDLTIFGWYANPPFVMWMIRSKVFLGYYILIMYFQ